MSSSFRNPLCDFRAINYPTAGVKATATTTAPAASVNPAYPQPFLVVQDISAALLAGTAAEAGVRINLIDGTSGGTNIVWTGVAAAAIGAISRSDKDSLAIPCRSGFATLEFVSAGGTTSQQAVSFGGYYAGGPGGQ